MKKILYVLLGTIIAMPAYAATHDNNRATIQSRAMVSTARKSSLKWDPLKIDNNVAGSTIPNTDPTPTPEPTPEPTPNNRDAERTACLANNIGIGNTFVWAASNSNTSSYATMVEDTENPDNNVCFARVGIRSNDNRVDLSGIDGKYFPMGTNITCGDWVSPDVLEEQILAATKSSRTWATVGGAVGGAGIGVGAMELFGNKLLSNIDGLKGLEGQKKLEGTELFVSQLLVLKKDNNALYNDIVQSLSAVKQACDEYRSTPKPEECKGGEKYNELPYEEILTGIGGETGEE